MVLHRTRVKICGITKVEDGLTAARVGADAIGLVFYSLSPRYVEIAQAVKIARAIPAFVSRVALFVDESAAAIQKVLGQVPLDYIQFHGEETPDFCDSFGKPYIKVLRVKPDMDVTTVIDRYPNASAILLDTWHPKLAGGTGEAFDWQHVPAEATKPIILAGGLTAENVVQAIRSVKPYAVDVSGGVELQKGVKSGKKIVEFVSAVNKAVR